MQTFVNINYKRNEVFKRNSKLIVSHEYNNMRAPSGDVEMKDSGTIIYQSDLKTTYITIAWSVYLCYRFVRQRAKESSSLDIFASES